MTEPTVEGICERHVITTECLKQKISAEGAEVLERHCEHWELIAPKLYFTSIEISDILADNVSKRARQRKAFLNKLREKIFVTYFHFLSSLCEIKKGGIADDAVEDLINNNILQERKNGTLKLLPHAIHDLPYPMLPCIYIPISYS